MYIQRTISITLSDDSDVRNTLHAFQGVQQQISDTAYNNGKPLSALALHRAVYDTVKGTLNSQMTCSAIRLVAGAYANATANNKPAQRPFLFRRCAALFLVGNRGRDASFKADDTLSIWTLAGPKHIAYTVPEAFQETLAPAHEVDSITVIERDGMLIGRMTVTLDVPDPAGIHPVGIDLNMTNALVAVDPDGNELFVSGKDIKVANDKTRKTRRCLQQKRATHKAEGKDTRTAARLIAWAPDGSVLVFERLYIPQTSKKLRFRKGTRRRLSQWQRKLMRQVDDVHPASTSQDCSRCGLRGVRKRHVVTCPHCGHTTHADVNAAINIRNRYTVLRNRGELSASPEARSSDVGKPME